MKEILKFIFIFFILNSCSVVKQDTSCHQRLSKQEQTKMKELIKQDIDKNYSSWHLIIKKMEVFCRQNRQPEANDLIKLPTYFEVEVITNRQGYKIYYYFDKNLNIIKRVQELAPAY